MGVTRYSISFHASGGPGGGTGLVLWPGKGKSITLADTCAPTANMCMGRFLQVASRIKCLKMMAGGRDPAWCD